MSPKSSKEIVEDSKHMNCVKLGVPLEIVLKCVLFSIFIRNYDKNTIIRE